MKDFFISYNKADRDWAISIDRWLKDAGYSTHIQEADFPPGSNWAYEMVQGGEATRTIAVLSPDYLKGEWIWPEMLAAFAADPKGENRKLLFVRVRDCQLPQLLRQIVDINLIGKTGEEAKQTLLAGVEASRKELHLPEPYPIDKLLARYCDHLQRKVSTVRIFGNAEPHSLDQVFVELTINEEYERRPNQAEFLGLMDSELRRMRSVFGDSDQHRDQDQDDPTQRHLTKTKRTIKPDELLRRHTHAVITGAPGCGKTTLLRYLAWQTLKQWQADTARYGTGSGSDRVGTDQKSDPPLPIFLELKSVAAADFKSSHKRSSKDEVNLLVQLLFDKSLVDFTGAVSKAERCALKAHFQNLLREGRVTIFLDGLDEVSGAKFFGDLQKAVTDFLHSAYGNNTVIISTRPFALRQLGDSKAMEIQPLSPRQIEQFIEHYYRDVPECQQFQRELQRRRELRELARVPALLGFILQLWRKRGSVTDDKLELYAQITLELAQQLDREKEGIAPEREWLVEDKDGSLKLDLLRQLAFNQIFRGLIHPPYEAGGNTNDVDRLIFTSEQLRDEAIAFARTLKEREGLTIHPRNLAEDVKATALLRQVGADHYAFAHLTLQEYLAAWQLAKRHNADTCERIFCRAYFNPTLAEMEVLPMTLGLVDELDKLYEALEQLPESLNFKGLRVRIRGLGYAASLNQDVFSRLMDRFVKFMFTPWNGELPHWEIVIRSFPQMTETFLEPITKRLVPKLKDEMSVRRWIAAKLLGQIGGERAIDALLTALQDEHSGVRQVAVEALAQSSSGQVVEALIMALSDEASIVRMKVVESLGEIGNERAIAVLLKVFESEDAWVKARLPEAFGKIGGEAIVAALAKVLQNPDRAIRIMAVRSLAEIADETAINTLVQALQDEDHSVRFRAAIKLSKLGLNEAMTILLNAALHPDITTRRLAIGALGETQEQRATEVLLNALQNEDEFIRIRAAEALGGMGGDKAKETLLNILQDTTSKMRRRAITALSKFGIKGIADFLRLALKDKDAFVRITAAETLGHQGGEEGFEVLVNELRNEDDGMRGLAVTSLQQFSGESIVLILLKALNDKNLDVSKKAAMVLGVIDNDDLSESLFKALDDEDRFVRRKAAETIGYYAISAKQIPQKLLRLSVADSMIEVGRIAKQAQQQFYRKLQYFNSSVSLTETHGYSQPSPPPLLTAHERAELETQIAAKYQEVLRGGDARQKGKALEELLAAVFASIPGFTVSESNYHTATEEIDLVLRNASDDPFWRGLGSLILVEAKNWQAQRVGKNEYVQFYRKLENRGGHCRLGFLVCTERFAETFHQEQLRDSKFPLRVVPIDGEDLRRLVESEDRGAMLREFVERAVLQ